LESAGAAEGVRRAVMKIQRRGFLGGLLALPFAGKLAEVIALKQVAAFNLQAAKRAWREYVKKCEDIAIAALWQGRDFHTAMAEVAEFKRLNPPPPYAKPKDRFEAMLEIQRSTPKWVG
jgi:hypothetical protein